MAKELNKYADMHCHSSFMTFLWRSKPRKTLRQKFLSLFKHRFVIALTDSSSDLDKLVDGNVKLISASLYAIERGFTQLGLVRFFLFFVTVIDAKRLRKIRNGQYGYHEQIRRNISYIKKALLVNPNPKFRVVNHSNEMIEDEKVNVVLSIEGAHGLISGANNQLESEDELWGNLNYLKSEQSFRIFYLTLVHIQSSIFCNHAMGIPQKALRHKDFLPRGNGISDLGFKLLSNCMSNEGGKPILIDVKHMSLKSRFEFYSWRKENFHNLPILASHMGVTGRSALSVDIEHFKLKDESISILFKDEFSELGVPFNPWTINLYDEEIVEILKSGGMIGISLDVGILGAQRGKSESLSLEECDFWKERITIKKENQVGIHKPKIKDIDYFVNNICHILKVAKENNCLNADKQICLGSDFDGLILPIKECTNALMIKDLRRKLGVRMIKDENLKNMVGGDVRVFLDGFFYQNYFDFVKNWI